MSDIFPTLRLRRLRYLKSIRDLIRETRFSPESLIMPYFVIEGKNKRESILSMPAIFRLSIDNLIKEIAEIDKIRVKAILLFGITDKKDKTGSESFNENGILQRAIRAVKSEFPDITIFSDVCLCGYTSYGHCGVIRKQKTEVRSQRKASSSVFCRLSSDFIDNDETLKVLAKIALSHAKAGVDFVSPSAMMDGQVKAIREGLDKNGFEKVGILAYSAKYASSFYGPFREALDSSPKFGDRASYQMDFSNIKEALREIREDIKEGADIVMVKPALSYLDIIREIKTSFNIPLAAYNVSGEYSMVKFAAKEGICDEKKMALEILTSIKRAGADMIITYFAKEVAKWIE